MRQRMDWVTSKKERVVSFFCFVGRQTKLCDYVYLVTIYALGCCPHMREPKFSKMVLQTINFWQRDHNLFHLMNNFKLSNCLHIYKWQIKNDVCQDHIVDMPTFWSPTYYSLSVSYKFRCKCTSRCKCIYESWTAPTKYSYDLNAKWHK